MERRIGTLRTTALCASIALAFVTQPPAARAEDTVDGVQQAVGEWARVRAETVRIESDWAWQRTLMQSTLDALKERLVQLEAKRDGLATKTAGERGELIELESRRKSMEAGAADAASRLREFDERLLKLRVWLPPRLSAALELPYRSLAAADLTLGERMQHTMAILNRCMLFNRAVSCGEELVVATGGEPKLMQVVYWGLAQGYALDRSAKTAYLGSPGANGWAWTAAPELLASVERLIAVAQDKREPEFVEVPVRLSEPSVINPQR